MVWALRPTERTCKSQDFFKENISKICKNTFKRFQISERSFDRLKGQACEDCQVCLAWRIEQSRQRANWELKIEKLRIEQLKNGGYWGGHQKEPGVCRPCHGGDDLCRSIMIIILMMLTMMITITIMIEIMIMEPEMVPTQLVKIILQVKLILIISMINDEKTASEMHVAPWIS